MGITTSDLHETARLSKVQEESRLLSNFLDWLTENDYAICQLTNYKFKEQGYVPKTKDNESLLAAYFKIDLAEVEKNRRELLRRIRISNSRRRRP